ncbi:MAG: polyprenyl synthetase family protein, partial [Duncaniella sp.]|nr:polyprenyl synthetase family protein [Duncaniella sp.]
MLTYDKYLATVNRAIERLALPDSPAGLYDPIRYTLSAGGKRIRPVLTLAEFDSLDRDTIISIHKAVEI